MIKEEIARGDAVILRTDTKAGLLLAVFGPITAVGVALLTKVSLHPAVTMLLAAAGLLGTAVLSRLSLRKFRLVRLACMLIALAVFLLVSAALVALVFRRLVSVPLTGDGSAVRPSPAT